MSNFQKSRFKTQWIKEGVDAECVDFMEDLGLFLCDKKNKNEKFPGFKAVTTSQLRNIFSEVKRIDVRLKDDTAFEKNQSEIHLLRPKIAYNTARVLSSRRDSNMQVFREILDKAILSISERKHFNHFSQFLEGVIAYHKVYGAKD